MRKSSKSFDDGSGPCNIRVTAICRALLKSMAAGRRMTISNFVWILASREFTVAYGKDALSHLLSTGFQNAFEKGGKP